MKGRPTQFKGKVTTRTNMLLLDSEPPPPTPMQKNVVVVRTQKTNLQKNAQWHNEKSHEENVGERRKAATKEATKIFAELAAGRVTNQKTQQKYIDKLNRQDSLDSEGRENTREKDMLATWTIRRLVTAGAIGTTPKKRRNQPTISRDFLNLVAFHINMGQVGVSGEMPTNQIKATSIRRQTIPSRSTAQTRGRCRSILHQTGHCG